MTNFNLKELLFKSKIKKQLCKKLKIFL